MNGQQIIVEALVQSMAWDSRKQTTYIFPSRRHQSHSWKALNNFLIPKEFWTPTKFFHVDCSQRSYDLANIDFLSWNFLFSKMEVELTFQQLS